MQNVQTKQDEQFITAREVAALLGVPPRWVMDKYREGLLPGYRLPGSNKARFLASEIRASMARAA
jgi:predicted DNA-binding transcriptional regulator AlpA